MSTEGGQRDIADVLRQLGRAAVLTEAENSGLKPANNRMRCCFSGCRDKPVEQRADTVTLYTGSKGIARLRCFRCSADGTLVDLLAATHGWTDAQAIAHLHGLPAPTARPPLHVVKSEMPAGADKLKPDEVRRVWSELATDDLEGRQYLEGRGLNEAVPLGLVRFATERQPSAGYWWRDKRTVCALLKDVVGNLVGLQGRLVRPLKPGEKRKAISLKGSSAKTGFFGSPELIESSPLIVVAEGLADTLAVAQWSKGSGAVVVGATGASFLHHIADELKRCGIQVEGKVFALFVQNDAPLNLSRAEFDRLGQLLHREGARVVVCSTEREFKDVADALKAKPDMHWPPAALAEVLGGETEHETQASKLVEPVRGGLPIAERITVESYGQNLSTLVALLDDPVHREAILGRRGELAFNEMTGELDFAGGELDETDITGIRLRLEQHVRTPDGKLLKFGKEDVWEALAYLSKRKRVHPVGDWLRGLKWDGEDLYDDFAQQLGLDPHSLEAMLLRKWCISAAARALEPGCKVDTVLVLVGDEGLKKSSLFRLLAGNDLFCDTPIQIGDVDGYGVLRRNWIVEWAELESMKRARDRGSVKSFLSSPDDNYRAKFMRGFGRIARSSVIVGTTNDPDFLQGFDNRRFWCIAVDSKRVNPRRLMLWLRQHREQLWAQSANVYTAAFDCHDCLLERPKDWAPRMDWERCRAHRWHLDEDFEPVLREHNKAFREVDEWASLLRAYVTKEEPVFLTVAIVLQHAVNKPAGQWNRSDQMRAAEALKTVGWRGPVRRHAGEVGRFYLPPQTELPLDPTDDPTGGA